MKEEPRPEATRGGWGYEGAPHSVPMQMPDRKETDETILYGPKGEALVVKRPTPFGFRPERTR